MANKLMAFLLSYFYAECLPKYYHKAYTISNAFDILSKPLTPSLSVPRPEIYCPLLSDLSNLAKYHVAESSNK